jgi:hypothetical protein
VTLTTPKRLGQPLTLGDFCRAYTAPARYLADGFGVYVSAQTGDQLAIGPAVHPAGEREVPDLPLPGDRELAGMLRAYRFGRSHG